MKKIITTTVEVDVAFPCFYKYGVSFFAKFVNEHSGILVRHSDTAGNYTIDVYTSGGMASGVFLSGGEEITEQEFEDVLMEASEKIKHLIESFQTVQP